MSDDSIVYPGDSAKTVPQSNNSATPASKDFPGRRKDNPLSNFSSYAYAVSLYMVSPDVANSFINSGGKTVSIKNNPGLYVVAQSGGINNDNENRIPNNSKALLEDNGGKGLDYYIDDVNLTTLLPGGKNRATASTEIKFKIVEPTGFTFLQDLAKASEEINKASALLGGNVNSQPNGFNQCYILGVRFYGYNADGSLVKASDAEFNGYTNGTSDQNSVVERYFSIRITNVKFKLDGKIVTYQCEAIVVSEQAAYGQINATIKNQLKLEGRTVNDVLNGYSGGSKNSSGLMKAMTNISEVDKDKKLVTKPTSYRIEFLDDQNKVDLNSPIAKATLIDEQTFASTASAVMTNKTTIDASFKATSYDPSSTTITITAGQSILNVIDNIITKSNYITDSLKETVSPGVEGQSKDKPELNKLRWYSINPVVKINSFDEKTNNWTYDIVYQIKQYDIAYIRSTEISQVSKYPGPFKFYYHWLTGKNSEILSYEQTYDNLFYTVASMSTKGEDGKVTGVGDSTVAVQNSAGNTDATTGAKNKGSQINENVRAQLYSPDQTQAKIKILGDPDYIMTLVGVNNPAESKFYGQNGSINPLSGQVFIQVVFNTATDYLSSGILDVSDQLQFYRTDRVQKAGIDGLVYMVNAVESSFARGTFTQTLDCLLVDENRLVTDAKAANKAAEGRVEAPTAAPTLAPSAASVSTTSVNNPRPSQVITPTSVTGQTPTSSTTRGQQILLNKQTSGIANPTVDQVRSSSYYINNYSRLGAKNAFDQARAQLQRDDQTAGSSENPARDNYSNEGRR